MTEFIAVPRPMTRRTTIFEVRRGNHVVASTGNETAASNIAAYLNRYRITTLDAWRQQPQPVRVAFISATQMLHPNLPHQESA